MAKLNIITLFHFLVILNATITIQCSDLLDSILKRIEKLEKEEIFTLKNTRRSNISRDQMKKYKNTTKVLIFMNNGVHSIPPEIDELEKLEILILDGNNLTSIDKNYKFPYIPSLRVLIISNYPKLKSIGSHVFQSFSNVDTMIIINNKNLVSIDPDAFTYYHPNSTEKYYLPIVKLDLFNNNLKIFPASLLENWKLLKYIEIQKNPWDCADSQNHFLINQIINHMKIIKSQSLDETYCSIDIENKTLNILMINFPKKAKNSKKCKDCSTTKTASTPTSDYKKLNDGSYNISSSTVSTTTLIMETQTQMQKLNTRYSKKRKNFSTTKTTTTPTSDYLKLNDGSYNISSSTVSTTTLIIETQTKMQKLNTSKVQENNDIPKIEEKDGIDGWKLATFIISSLLIILAVIFPIFYYKKRNNRCKLTTIDPESGQNLLNQPKHASTDNVTDI